MSERKQEPADGQHFMERGVYWDVFHTVGSMYGDRVEIEVVDSPELDPDSLNWEHDGVRTNETFYREHFQGKLDQYESIFRDDQDAAGWVLDVATTSPQAYQAGKTLHEWTFPPHVIRQCQDAVRELVASWAEKLDHTSQCAACDSTDLKATTFVELQCQSCDHVAGMEH